MKRKLLFLTAIILTLSLTMMACTQKSVNEVNAKQIALDYINTVFDTNETEATVKMEEMGCLPYQVGAVATQGNAAETSRWLHIVEIPGSDTEMKYQVYVVAKTSEVIYATQSDANIVLTQAQQAEADSLQAEESSWGKQHEKGMSKLKVACEEFAKEKLNEPYPIVVDAMLSRIPGDPIQTTFVNWYYVITRDGRVYWTVLQYPSMQLVAISLENAK